MTGKARSKFFKNPSRFARSFPERLSPVQMKRIQEKVKDLVEVRSLRSLQDFTVEPQATLAGYHFTDITSDLMAKYLDRIAAVKAQNGAASALAGYRGVGKSHFLATLGAIASHTELRSRIADAHAAASAERLKRARYPVAYVRRGTRPTLIEELRDAVAKTFEIDAESLGNSVAELLNFAAQKSGELTFLLIVDTAFERVSRVARDDGALLGEIAEIAKRLNVFVAAALDDDIAGADGINAAIAKSFTIDYLDQEHLYRIVDAHVFPKNRQHLPVLHDIYTNFREALPGFRWSEQRFSALYPLHPVILEIAPFVRLYVPEFALLGFAAEAGKKIMARPANSLIAPDEVFDQVETALRKIDDLKEAFAAYDRINREAVSQIPFVQRLQAKLALKALFLLSLEGEGATAGEIGASMLIYDETDSRNSAKTLEDLLENFAAAFPAEILRKSETDREIRYNLKIGGADDLNRALAEAISTVSPDAVVPKIMRRAAREKFSEWTFADDEMAPNFDSIETSVVWRGSLRHGRLVWNPGNKLAAENFDGANRALDWEIIISATPKNNAAAGNADDVSKIFWQPAPLRADEIETLLRYYVLLNDKDLTEKYGEQARIAAHAHNLAAEKIWSRAFLEDARIVVDGFDCEFSERARTVENLTEVLSNMLEPLFEARFPNHPYFLRTLRGEEVAALVSDFFGGARRTSAEAQRLAETFALPLGLVAPDENIYVIEREESLINQPFAREVLNLVDANAEKTVSLRAIYERLGQSPNGLTEEAAHLILTALVAERQIEFITTKGDRISRRSLDLRVVWSDIEGVAKPANAVYSNERLTEWARMLTGSDSIRSIDTGDERSIVRDALENWLADWKTARLLQRFGELPDDVLNTKIWRLAAHAEKTFGAVAAVVSAVADRSIALEEGLHRIADAFSDSENELFARTSDLIVLEDFTNGIGLREKIWNYLALSENTSDEKIEYFREKLVDVIEQNRREPSDALNRETENLWTSFRAEYAEHYALKHDAVMKSPHLRERLDEITGGDAWWEFETLSRLSIFQTDFSVEARAICRRLKQLECRFEVGDLLETRPFCVCSFSLSQMREYENLPAQLERVVERGRESYLKILRANGNTLAPLIRRFAAQSGDAGLIEAAETVSEIVGGAGERREPLTNDELIVLQRLEAQAAL